ncbi:hypothetical protein F5Y14DRAFT_453513 [Nemania sp. NC0429]|nr:hypothetical protein F5Y14DRAFT_453513 [Nemania sp. NC0429]
MCNSLTDVCCVCDKSVRVEDGCRGLCSILQAQDPVIVAEHAHPRHRRGSVVCDRRVHPIERHNVTRAVESNTKDDDGMAYNGGRLTVDYAYYAFSASDSLIALGLLSFDADELASSDNGMAYSNSLPLDYGTFTQSVQNGGNVTGADDMTVDQGFQATMLKSDGESSSELIDEAALKSEMDAEIPAGLL